ncbi:DUF423 domain-containing protein [Vibrio sp. SCSIO 43137]|uniref:DUF423 domain-containing protein n=1 Tax=Vibrio sp. SCSIO 43137 TaxID=3021011 RepID=UPI0023081EB3|nr:DUF423 domain-containing protein [Vibrio sp. SCSIO 43137]WCE30397.1 DUF423 domain-containing protein [Vibrio sp. SCSIO 43137]
MNSAVSLRLLFAGLSGMSAVGLGAFAAHGLKSRLSEYLLSVFETGVLYQFLHTLAIIACVVLIQLNSDEKMQKSLLRASNCFIIGILCFSGSLYGLALTGIKWFGPVTPFGGLMFMLGWGFITYSAIQRFKVTQ